MKPNSKLWAIPLIIVMLSAAAYAQVHVSFGRYAQLEAGVDIHKAAFGFTSEVDVMKICKKPGGCGHQWDARTLVSKRITDKISVQAGAVYSSYKVVLFGKRSLQTVTGIRLEARPIVAELNYRHDLTSENKLRIVETRMTGYLPHHIFARWSLVFKRFRDFYHQPRYTPDVLVSAGVYF